jgi:hypothetical protein
MLNDLRIRFVRDPLPLSEGKRCVPLPTYRLADGTLAQHLPQGGDVLLQITGSVLAGETPLLGVVELDGTTLPQRILIEPFVSGNLCVERGAITCKPLDANETPCLSLHVVWFRVPEARQNRRYRASVHFYEAPSCRLVSGVRDVLSAVGPHNDMATGVCAGERAVVDAVETDVLEARRVASAPVAMASVHYLLQPPNMSAAVKVEEEEEEKYEDGCSDLPSIDDLPPLKRQKAEESDRVLAVACADPPPVARQEVEEGGFPA